MKITSPELLERAKDAYTLGEQCGMVGNSKFNIYVILKEIIDQATNNADLRQETIYVNVNGDGTLGELETDLAIAQKVCDTDGHTYEARLTLIQKIQSS